MTYLILTDAGVAERQHDHIYPWQVLERLGLDTNKSRWKILDRTLASVTIHVVTCVWKNGGANAVE